MWRSKKVISGLRIKRYADKGDLSNMKIFNAET